MLHRHYPIGERPPATRHLRDFIPTLYNYLYTCGPVLIPSKPPQSPIKMSLNSLIRDVLKTGEIPHFVNSMLILGCFLKVPL